jgi:hypothetical protein
MTKRSDFKRNAHCRTALGHCCMRRFVETSPLKSDPVPTGDPAGVVPLHPSPTPTADPALKVLTQATCRLDANLKVLENAIFDSEPTSSPTPEGRWLVTGLYTHSSNGKPGAWHRIFLADHSVPVTIANSGSQRLADIPKQALLIAKG